MLLTEMLVRNAERDPQGLAFVFLDDHGKEQRRLTHEEMADLSKTLCNQFLEAGWGGTTAFLLFDHGLEFALAFHACLAAGITCVPLAPPEEGKLDFQVGYWKTLAEDTSANLIFSSGAAFKLLASASGKLNPENKPLLCDFAEIMKELPKEKQQYKPNFSDRAALLYTSGSTSAPKGVSLLHGNLVYNARSCCECWQITQDSVLATWMPNHHSFGLIYNVLLSAFSGCTVVSLSTGAFIRNPRLWFEMVHTYKATHGAAATFGYQLCTDCIKPLKDLDLSSWQVGLISAEPVRRGVCDNFLAAFKSLGLPDNFFCPLYGLSETGPITSMPVNVPSQFFRKPDAPDHLALACVGLQLPGTNVFCVNPDSGKLCPNGETGEIWVSGPSVMAGYFRREAANSEAFSALPSHDAPCFRTGDQGFIDHGYVYITGRLKEVIIVRGKNYYPQDIEWLGRECHDGAGLGAAAAFVSDQERQTITLVIEVAPEVVGDEKTGMAMAKKSGSFIAQKLGLHIHEIVLVPPHSIPKTASGKIQRAACRQALEDEDLDLLHLERLTFGSTATPVVADSTLSYVQQLFAQKLSMTPEEVDPSLPIGDYQLDSVSFLELAQAIETQQNQTFHPANFFRFQSLGELAEYLDSKKS